MSSSIQAQEQAIMQQIQALQAAAVVTPAQQQLIGQMDKIKNDLTALDTDPSNRTAASNLQTDVKALLGAKGTINADGSFTADPSSVFGQLQASTMPADKALCGLVSTSLESLNGNVGGSESLLAAAFAGNFANTETEIGNFFTDSANYSLFQSAQDNVDGFKG